MIIIFLIKVFSLLNDIPLFTEKDFNLEKLLIYFHDTKLDSECDSCKRFINLPSKINDYEVRRVDYSSDEIMSLRFFVLYVPHFIIRKNNSTFTLYPYSLDHLLNLIEKEEFNEKIDWFFDPSNFYMKYFAYLVKKLIWMSDSFNNKTVLIGCFIIISYLMGSICFLIKDMYKEEQKKNK